jgi:hypothetical protein
MDAHVHPSPPSLSPMAQAIELHMRISSQASVALTSKSAAAGGDKESAAGLAPPEAEAEVVVFDKSAAAATEASTAALGMA